MAASAGQLSIDLGTGFTSAAYRFIDARGEKTKVHDLRLGITTNEAPTIAAFSEDGHLIWAMRFKLSSTSTGSAMSTSSNSSSLRCMGNKRGRCLVGFSV